MFPNIDRAEELLNEIAQSLPEKFYEELNLGIVLSPDTVLHPYSTKNNPIYTMGQYRKDMTGNQIEIFYGSFEKAYYYLDEQGLYEKLKEVLLHEFRHHIETRAGVNDLVIWDSEKLKSIKEGRWQN